MRGQQKGVKRKDTTQSQWQRQSQTKISAPCLRTKARRQQPQYWKQVPESAWREHEKLHFLCVLYRASPLNRPTRRLSHETNTGHLSHETTTERLSLSLSHCALRKQLMPLKKSCHPIRPLPRSKLSTQRRVKWPVQRKYMYQSACKQRVVLQADCTGAWRTLLLLRRPVTY